ncbi:hypothetical protein ACHAPJ_011741 [Fusarium lateritium]
MPKSYITRHICVSQASSKHEKAKFSSQYITLTDQNFYPAQTPKMAEHPWWKIKWFANTDTPKERKLILKLDLLIVPYVFLAYWVKYIDQSNINNAYVSGMREDLKLYGNELVQFQTLYTVGAVVGQLPFMYLLTHVPL